MNPKLLHTCVSAWLLGLLGMCVSRGLFDLGPGALSFDLPARVWAVGGIGYVFLGLIRMATEHTADDATEELELASARRAGRAR